jgi:hypothetical protein
MASASAIDLTAEGSHAGTEQHAPASSAAPSHGHGHGLDAAAALMYASASLQLLEDKSASRRDIASLIPALHSLIAGTCVAVHAVDVLGSSGAGAPQKWGDLLARALG